jgi:molybdate transport system substrate-binding protein
MRRGDVPTRLLFCALVSLTVGCGGAPAVSSPFPGSSVQEGPGPRGSSCAAGECRDQLVVYAAASLGDSLRSLATAYEAGHATVRVVLAFDSSSALRARIEEGAPADVFAAADTENPDRIVQEGLSAGAAVTFARNRLAIVVPDSNPARITQPADLARQGVRIVAAGEAVPVSKYARQLVSRLAALPGAPATFVAGYDANVVSREDNVRAALAKVELGEADAAIVYETDTRSNTLVRSISIPDEVNVAATYAAVAVRRDRDNPAGREFVAWLRGETAQRILGAAGFLAP